MGPSSMRIFYHANCLDGFTSAWLLHKIYPHAEFIPAKYGERLNIRGCDEVIVVDFCPQTDQELSEINEAQLDPKHKLSAFLLIDHHPGVSERCQALSLAHIWEEDECGASLVLKHFFSPDSEHSRLVKYIRDRDLWKRELPFSEEISALISTVPRTFESWDELSLELTANFRNCVIQGDGALRMRRSLAEECVKSAFELKFSSRATVDRYPDLGGWNDVKIPATYCPGSIRSDVAHLLAEKTGDTLAAAIYIDEDSTAHISFRGKGARTIAKIMGGGGHELAAGASVNSWILESDMRGHAWPYWL